MRVGVIINVLDCVQQLTVFSRRPVSCNPAPWLCPRSRVNDILTQCRVAPNIVASKGTRVVRGHLCRAFVGSANSNATGTHIGGKAIDGKAAPLLRPPRCYVLQVLGDAGIAFAHHLREKPQWPVGRHSKAVQVHGENVANALEEAVMAGGTCVIKRAYKGGLESTKKKGSSY